MVKRSLLLLLAVLAVSSTHAQSAYIGLRLAGATLLDESAERLPYLGLQVGVGVLDPIELRAAYDESIGVTYAHTDLLYSQPLGDGVRGYAGAGLDYYLNRWNSKRGYGVHGTAGVEYRTGVLGLFAEVQPIYGFGIAAFRIRSSLGINFHF